jgi:hypothetical protein
MSRIGEEDEVPPQFDNENNMNNNQKDDKSRASEGPSLEDLMRRLEKLTTKNNKLRRKAKGNVIPDFFCQNQVLIVCMTQDQLFHTYRQKCSQITKCHE